MSEQPLSAANGTGLPQSADQLSDLSEKIYHELSEQVPLEQIDHLVGEAAAQFEDATVTTFVPLLIQRQVLARLNEDHVTESMIEQLTESEDTDQTSA